MAPAQQGIGTVREDVVPKKREEDTGVWVLPGIATAEIGNEEVPGVGSDGTGLPTCLK